MVVHARLRATPLAARTQRRAGPGEQRKNRTKTIRPGAYPEDTQTSTRELASAGDAFSYGDRICFQRRMDGAPLERKLLGPGAPAAR